MKLKILSLFAISILLVSMFQSCEKENDDDDKENETNISSNGDDESHNMGMNCMNCHLKGGDGKGWFNIAGTVYDSILTNTYPNAIVKLYTGPNASGTLKGSIEVDQLGNFYTTENIDFGNGLYPSVEGQNMTNFMSSPITKGECNTCHGVSVSKIWTK